MKFLRTLLLTLMPVLVMGQATQSLRYLSPSIQTTETLSGDVTLPAGNFRVLSDPSIAFSGGLYRADNLIPWQVKPVYSGDLFSQLFDSTYNGYWNVFLRGAYAKATGTANVVALFGEGEAAANGANAWGGNHVAIASASGGTAIADELDSAAIVSGGLAYGLILGSTGYVPAQNAVQIQSNRPAAGYVNGINFNYSANGQPVTTSLITGSNSLEAAYAIKLPGIYSGLELFVPSFQVGATPINKLVATGASGTGSTATVTFASTTNFPWVGANVTVASVNPSGYNATAQVTAATATSVAYGNATSSSYVSGGAVTVSNPTITVTGASVSSGTVTLTYANAAATGYPATGNKVIVAGIVSSGTAGGLNTTGYNGTFTVATATATQLTYASTNAVGTYVSGGTIAPDPISAVTAAVQVSAARGPGNTAQISVLSAGQGASNAGLELLGLGSGSLYLNGLTAFVDSSGNLTSAGGTFTNLTSTNTSFQGGTTYSAASWGLTSPLWNAAAETLNDTTASGTVSNDYAYTIQAPTFTSTGGASTTITNVGTLYVTKPACSGGVICSNLYGIFTNGYLGASIGANISGGIISLNVSTNNNTNINTGTSTGTVTIGNTAGTGSALAISAPTAFSFGTSLSQATWGTTGVALHANTGTYNDTTVGSGTVTNDAAVSLMAPTFTNTQGTANTLTNAINFYLAAPVCGSGWSACTNLYSLYSQGAIAGLGGATFTGATFAVNPSSNNTTNINTGTSTGALHLADGSGNNAIGIGNGTGKVTVGGPLLSANLNSSQFTVASGTGSCATSSTITGGVQAGSFVCTGTTGASTATLTLKAATTGYSCWGSDITTPTTLTQTGAVSTTSVTLTMTAVVANDVIQFGCLGY